MRQLLKWFVLSLSVFGFKIAKLEVSAAPRADDISVHSHNKCEDEWKKRVAECIAELNDPASLLFCITNANGNYNGCILSKRPRGISPIPGSPPDWEELYRRDVDLGAR